jgi:hypothetical protein
LEPNTQKGTKLGSPSYESGPESGPLWKLRVKLSRCSGLLRLKQPCTATAQGCLFIAQVSITCAQVSKWKWNLGRSRFGCEYSGIDCLKKHIVNPHLCLSWLLVLTYRTTVTHRNQSFCPFESQTVWHFFVPITGEWLWSVTVRKRS